MVCNEPEILLFRYEWPKQNAVVLCARNRTVFVRVCLPDTTRFVNSQHTYVITGVSLVTRLV